MSADVPAEQAAAPSPLRSVHTSSFAQLLAELRLTVLVTTYQAGKLVILRADDGRVNTHFRTFSRPMGLAAAPNRLALGATWEIVEFINVPAAAGRLPPPGRHDACYLPLLTNFTGDIHIHEMAWAGTELWFVNTSFSCLCTRSAIHSFVPRWRPAFISSLTPEDRCHLNGLGLVDGVPRYATALGEVDAPRGWRQNKKNGGILIDIPSNTIIARGLSMPHSPRWYAGRLWVLDSGTGGVGTVEPASGRYEQLAELPGFTRGLDFFGRFAFIGLSQVRETAVFSGIAITEKPMERTCGVWVLDLTTGQVVAFLKFEEAVQEIFAIQVLPGVVFPDVINDNPELLSSTYILPDEALANVPESFRAIMPKLAGSASDGPT